MLERMLLPDTHAIAILLKDHDTVKALFDRFERATAAAEKNQIIAAAIVELKIHASIEEEIFYPAVRRAKAKSRARWHLAGSGACDGQGCAGQNRYACLS